jgi:hypothetical protein
VSDEEVALRHYAEQHGTGFAQDLRSFFVALDAERAARQSATPRLRFGQEVILDCGPGWGGDRTFYVGWVERTESLSVSGQLLHTTASREYVLQDALDAPSDEAVARRYPAALAPHPDPEP